MFDLKDVIRVGKYSSGRKYLVFKCSTTTCSNELRLTPSRVKRYKGYCTSCLQKKDPFGVIYRKLLLGAKSKGVDNTLTYLQFLTFTSIKNCVYCGKFIEWTKYLRAGESSKPYNLDRKDSSLGYSKENCVVCCGRCNKVKNNFFSYEEFLLIGKVLKQIDEARKSLLTREESYGILNVEKE